ncbi:MAG: glycosyltransferase family 87 protein [Planctomycetota bacterium]
MNTVGRRLFWITTSLALAVCCVQTIRKALRPYGYDLTAYLDAGAAALAGQSPYGLEVTFPYLYSPFFACLMVPWTWLPGTVAALLWFAISVWSLGYVVARVGGWVGGTARSGGWWLAAMALLAVGWYRIVHSNLVNGQVNLILLAMCVASFEAERRGRSARAGFWLALAVHTKALPILLLGYLLVRRRWAAIGWCASFGVAFAVAPAVFWGDETLAVYRAYVEQLQQKIARGTIDDGAITIASRGDLEYFTLRGLLAVLLPSTSASVLVKYACLAAVVGGAFVVDLVARRSRERLVHGAAFATWLAASLLISPISEKHHLALTFPAWAVGAFAVARRPSAVAIGLLAACTVVIWIAKHLPEGPWYLLTIVVSLAMVWHAASPRSGQVEREAGSLREAVGGSAST